MADPAGPPRNPTIVTLSHTRPAAHARAIQPRRSMEEGVLKSQSGRKWSPVVSRLPALALATIAVVGALGLLATPSQAAALPDRDEQLRFMWAVAGQESGWDYYARNPASGAFGKYQIMPSNWPVWARQFVGDAQADQTPFNQEAVAFGKLRGLYAWLGSWKRVAYWWLTGSSEKNEQKWSSYAKGYVYNIMRLRKKAPPNGSPMPPKSSSRPDSGDWRRSGSDQKLRLSVGGKVWPARGRVRDGQVLKVRSVRTVGSGVRWIRVVTVDGRLGWLRQLSTVPAHRPASPRLWNDIKDEGQPVDRRAVRPKPR